MTEVASRGEPQAPGLTPPYERLPQRLVETLRNYWYLGFTCFGGPAVHVVILRKRFVDQLRWVDATTFADLFSLGNALPGPGSTQLAFSIATVRNGTLAGFMAFFLWSLPASCGMAALGAGIRTVPNTLPAIVQALLTGLNAAAVGLIALAAYQLSSAAVTDGVTRLCVLGSACFGICYHAPWMYPTLMVVGALMTFSWDHRRPALKLVAEKSGLARAQEKRRRNKGKSKDQAEREVPPGQADERTARLQQEETGDIALYELNRTTSEATYDEDRISIAKSAGERDRSESPNPRKETFRTSSELAPSSSSHQAPPQPSASASASVHSLRQRGAIAAAGPSAGITDAPAAPADAATSQSHERSVQLRTLNKWLASLTFALFVATLVILIAVRAVYSHRGDVPRALDLLTNMYVAGTILFGGGPVVVGTLSR